MSSTYSPITILDPTTHLRNTHHWPHVQYVQSYHYIIPPTYETHYIYIRSHTLHNHTYETHITDHMSSTYSPIAILYPTTHLRNTHHWPHVQYVQSYHYIIYETTDHMSSTYSPIHLRNTHHWPHVQYVQSYHYIRSHHPTYITNNTDHMSSTYSPITILYVPHPLTEQTTLTTCPVRTVQSLY